MVFDSKTFVIFFAVFFVLYYAMFRHYRVQNILVLVASYVFYGMWDWRFLGLVFLQSFLDYCAGLAIPRASAPWVRRAILISSVVVNLSVLGVFKYFDFF